MVLIRKVFGWLLLVLGSIWLGAILAMPLLLGISYEWFYTSEFLTAASFFLISIMVIYGGWRILKGLPSERPETLIKAIVVLIVLEMIIIAVTYGFTEDKHGLVASELIAHEITDLIVYFSPDVYKKNMPYVKESGERVYLVNYKNASDPSWDELIAFLERDDTDEYQYSEGVFDCADFAEMLHDNAESSGIKAAWVAVDFVEGEGHALNAFNTTDTGLVYVDCTSGFSPPVIAEDMDDEAERGYEHDKIAYVVEGKTYGVISIDKATSPEYGFYDEYKQKWEELEEDKIAHNDAAMRYQNDSKAYADDVEAYETAVGGRTHTSDPAEYERLNRTYNDLKARGDELELRADELDAELARLFDRQEDLGLCHWEPLGVVTIVEVYW